MTRAGLLLVLMVLPSCAVRGPARVEVPAGQYGAAFDAARGALTAQRFELDRVDARAGVITTKAKTTAGFATPWDLEQSSVRQETEDLLNDQRRTVRVTFIAQAGGDDGEPAPAGAGGAAGAAGPVEGAAGATPAEGAEGESGAGGAELARDLRAVDAPLTAPVEVTLERVRRPGWRLEPSAIRFSSRAFDPALAQRGLWPVYAVTVSEDEALARRIARAIEEGMRRSR